MKKVYIISAITIIVGLIFYFYANQFKFLWGAQLLLLPIIAGVLLAVIQDKNRSYEFLPGIVIGSFISSFVFTCVIQVFECFDYSYGPHCPIPSLSSVIPFVLMLSGIFIFGGLIGIVIKGIFLLLKIKKESKLVLFLRKISGGLLIGIGSAGSLFCIVIFLILSFHPSSSLLNRVMVDFRLIDVTGFVIYYLLLLSTLAIVLIPLVFVIILGLSSYFIKKNFFNPKLFIKLALLFFLFLAVFFPLSFYVESRFEEKKAMMKENQIERYFDIKDFHNISVSRFVEFDTIIVKQGQDFNIVAKGSEYDQIGLDFEKVDNNTLLIKRSELETYYNTDTWTMENRDKFFPAGTKNLTIEITIPDVEKILLSGGNMELMDLEVDNIEIALNKRFNNIKGNIIVKDTLKLDAKGGIINLNGSAENLIINSGDCWIEMDELDVENAEISANNTSRLNVNVSDDLEIKSNNNSVITNHYDE